jgi:hypothetical protein
MNLVLIVPSLVLLACADLTGPPFPAGAIAIDPPSAYALWWTLTEECSGVKGDFSSVRWYVLPNAWQFDINGEKYQAYWWGYGNSIVTAAHSKLDGQLVRHEMLHALTGPTHSALYYLDKCAGVVSCEGSCLTEAGGSQTPPSNAPVISMSEVHTEFRIDPVNRSAAKDSGWVAMTVSIVNPRDYPVWVQLSPIAEGATASATFGYILVCHTICGSWESYRYIWGSTFLLGARQTQRFMFDLQLPPSAEFSARGFFNTDTTAAMER